MRFQSKYRTHTIQVRGTRRFILPGSISPTIEAGIFVKFEGPQRIFDSEKQGWDAETVNMVEDFVLKHKHYGNGIYLAPGQELPAEKLEVARVKPKATKLFCSAVSVNQETGEIDQCPKEPTVGRKYCMEHDPDEVKITRGGATTVD